MIADDVDVLLKYLDDVSQQLASLLDIDGQRGNSRKTKPRQRVSLAARASKVTGGPYEKTAAITSNGIQKRQQQSTLKLNSTKRSTKGSRGRRRSKANIGDNQLIETNSETEQLHHQEDQIKIQLSSTDSRNQQIQDVVVMRNQAHLANKQITTQTHQQASNQHHHTETHTLDGQLTSLTGSLTDDLPLDHGSSISPLDPTASLQFASMQQHYHYAPSRSQLDSYSIQDEFASHETIPMSNSSSSHMGPQSSDQQQLQQRDTHLISNQPSSSTLSTNDCYPQHPHLHQQPQQHQQQHQHHVNQHHSGHHQNDNQQQHNHHGHQNHHHHHHHHHHHDHSGHHLNGQHLHNQHHQHQHHQHQVQYHQLDHQWLLAPSHSGDNTLQLGHGDANPLDHVLPLSPATHQSLDHVQFGPPLYHHGYYSHQSDQLDSFQHINDDYSTNSESLTTNPSSISHIHRLQQQQADPRDGPNSQAQQQQQSSSSQSSQQTQPQQQHHTQVQMTELDANSANGNSSHNNVNNSNDSHRLNQQQQHIHHAQYGNQQQQLNHHQMMPILNGIEASAVIIQDINLASASWSSPEDLYSI